MFTLKWFCLILLSLGCVICLSLAAPFVPAACSDDTCFEYDCSKAGAQCWKMSRVDAVKQAGVWALSGGGSLLENGPKVEQCKVPYCTKECGDKNLSKANGCSGSQGPWEAWWMSRSCGE